MSPSRFQGRAIALLCLSAWFASAAAAVAQPQAKPAAVPAPTPAATASQPAAAKPTPAPTSTLQSMPAATPQTYNPQPPAGTPPYSDPLQQPLNVPSASAQAPVPVTMPQPALNANLPSVPAYDPQYGVKRRGGDALGSTYIPVDSPIYTEVLRLYSLGYMQYAFISMRPWTRRSLLHLLDAASPDIIADNNQQALEILADLNQRLADETPAKDAARGLVYGPETFYTRVMGVEGQTLRDSFHLGQTIVNDYGRPYEPGFNDLTGFSSVNEWGRFSLYVRGEYEHSPSGVGYSPAMIAQLSGMDLIPYPGVNNYNFFQDTIPATNILSANPFRLQEATLSFHFLGHEISGGKSDAWLGPGYGGAMGWSNNAEDIYSFRINRVDPLHIPLLSRLIGPLRYDFFVGSLKGHTDPNSPWIHSEMFSFRPTHNVEFSFQRGVIWGGQGFEPVTLHTFLKSFFSFQDTESDPASKGSRNDPGARFSDFSFSWRLPYLAHYVTLYADSIAHDDVTPISAPRRAAYRPGVYISQFPGLRRLDFRVEASSTDTSTLRSEGGFFNYYETIQKQGYTNKGFILGDWMGREAKGGQAWLTYHLSGNQWIQLEYLDKKTPKDFIPGGVTQGQFKAEVVKRIRPDIELDAWVRTERWKAPFPVVTDTNYPFVVDGPAQYYPNATHDTVVAFQVTFFPKLRTQPHLNGK